MYLFQLHFLNFVETPSPHALNRNSTDIDEPQTDSLLYESTLPLGCMEFWLVQVLEGCSITRLLSSMFVNLKSTEKRYRIKRSTSPIEIINNKK